MIEKKDVFPTPIFQGKIDNYQEINKVILEELYELKKYELGTSKSNVLVWHSKSDLHLNGNIKDSKR